MNEAKIETVGTFDKCTIYLCGLFGYRRIDCRSVVITRKPYAQYDTALHVAFTPKGGRARRGFVAYAYRVNADGSGTDSPFVVVDARDAFDVADPMTATKAEGGSIVSSMTRHLSCDPAWRVEFDAKLRASGARVLFDGRDGGRAPAKRAELAEHGVDTEATEGDHGC